MAIVGYDFQDVNGIIGILSLGRGETIMRTVGIVREVDNLGRVVLPVELREILGINKGDPIEIFVDDEKIVFKKFLSGCIFCGIGEQLVNHNGKHVCQSCLKDLKEQVSLE